MQPPTSQAPAAPGGYYTPVGQPPHNIGGVFYSVGLTILLMIVTLGIWGFFWTYRTNEDLKRYNGDGLGGVLGIVIYFLLAVVLMFTIPNEIKNMYERDGRKSPVTGDLGAVVPAAAHRQHRVVREGAAVAQPVLGEQGVGRNLSADLTCSLGPHRRAGEDHGDHLVGLDRVERGEHAGQPCRAGRAGVDAGDGCQLVRSQDLVLGHHHGRTAARPHRLDHAEPVVGLVVDDPVGR